MLKPIEIIATETLDSGMARRIEASLTEAGYIIVKRKPEFNPSKIGRWINCPSSVYNPSSKVEEVFNPTGDILDAAAYLKAMQNEDIYSMSTFAADFPESKGEVSSQEKIEEFFAADFDEPKGGVFPVDFESFPDDTPSLVEPRKNKFHSRMIIINPKDATKLRSRVEPCKDIQHLATFNPIVKNSLMLPNLTYIQQLEIMVVALAERYNAVTIWPRELGKPISLEEWTRRNQWLADDGDDKEKPNDEAD